MRRLLKIVAVLAAALAAASLAVWLLIDRVASAPRLKPRIEAAASGYLGRPLTIETLEWRRGPHRALVGTNVRLYDGPGKTRVLVESPVVEARVALISLSNLAAGIPELKFEHPKILMRRDARGLWDVEQIVDEIAKRPSEPARRWGAVAFNWFTVEDALVSFQDDQGRLKLPNLRFSGSGKLRFGRRRSHFPFDATARIPGNPASLRLTGTLGHDPSFEARVQDGDTAAAALAWPPAGRWTARWRGSLSYRTRPPEQWTLKIRAEPVVFSTAARLDILDLSGVYAPAGETRFSLSAVSSSTRVSAEGSWSADALRLKVDAPRVDLADVQRISREAAASFPLRRRDEKTRALLPHRVEAALAVDDVRYKEMAVRRFRAELRTSGGVYVADPIVFESLAGSVTARLSYAPSAPTEALKISWKTSGVSAQDLFRLAGSTTPVGGTADTHGSLTTLPGERFLHAMNGEIALDFKNGWIGDMPALLKILSRLNIASFLSRISGHRRARVPFDEAQGLIRIQNGRASTVDPFVLKNKTLEMAFMGSYDLPGARVDGKVVVNFLTVTDEIIHLLPGVRDILLGGEKGLVPIWVQVRGPASDPDVKVLSWRSVADPAWNAVKRAVTLPKTLFDKLKGK